MSELNLKESEIQTLKCNLDGKEAQILSFEQTISGKDELIHKMRDEKKEIKDNLSKETTRLAGNYSLINTKHILWDYLETQIEKLQPYFQLIEDEQALTSSSKQSCWDLKQEIKYKHLEEMETILTYVSTTSKVDLLAIGIPNGAKIRMSTKKLIEKNNLLNNVEERVNFIFNKVKYFKVKFYDLFQQGLPSFWDGQQFLMYRKDYEVLFAQQKNEKSKFQDLDKQLKGQIVVNKLIHDFEFLIHFKERVRSLPPLSYAHINEIKDLTKELDVFYYPSTTTWTRITMIGKRLRII